MKQTLLRALALLWRNPALLVPALVLALAGQAAAYDLSAAGYLSWRFFGDLNAAGPDAFRLFIETIVALALRIAVSLLAIAFTTGMASAAWTRGRARLSHGAQQLRREGVPLAQAMLVLLLIGLAAAALVIPTFGISLLAYMAFTIYTIPLVAVAGRPMYDALVDSLRIAAQNLGSTFVLVLLILTLAAAGAAAGPVVSWVLMEAAVAYATVVATGECLELRKAGNQASR